MSYTGRFAPSPTGPLHLGSLIAALASYLHAHKHQGRWLVRMEDLDPPREMPGAADSILQSLEAHGLLWHDQVMFQSQRLEAYQEVLESLRMQGQVYPCNCTRARLNKLGGIYDNHCRTQNDISTPFAWRLAVEDCILNFQDLWQGKHSQNVRRDVGDFILKRKDGLFAYQLAVVVDDIELGVNWIIRGSDLLDSSARQLYLFDLLGQNTVNFGHIPVITNDLGQKFSKQNHAPALNNHQASKNLWSALCFLNQSPPSELSESPVEELLDWAKNHFNSTAIAPTLAIAANKLQL